MSVDERLDLETAKGLARMLKSIPGFAWDEDNITATAMDLQHWCKGAVIDNEDWPRQDQATWLTKEMRETWEKWKGTAAMRQLFRAKFERKQFHPEQNVFDKAKWEEEHGPADPEWTTKLLKLAVTGNRRKDLQNGLLAMRYQGIRDALYFTEGQGRFELDKQAKRHDQKFWQEAMDGYNKKHPDLVAFFRDAIAAHQLDALPPVPQHDPLLTKAYSPTQQEHESLSPAIPETPTVRPCRLTRRRVCRG